MPLLPSSTLQGPFSAARLLTFPQRKGGEMMGGALSVGVKKSMTQSPEHFTCTHIQPAGGLLPSHP